jgi:hypothetical protein
MRIRKANHSDLPRILEIFSCAREQMQKNGNPNQWGSTYPPKELLEEDIARGRLYVEEETEIEGVFVFFLGEDPTYAIIDGAWKNDLPYGVIHRVASAGRVKGTVGRIVSFCKTKCPNLRIDTHEVNLIMQRCLEKNGFMRCGIIWIETGAPRIAYQLTES